MKKLILPLLFLLSCGTTQQVAGPTVYVPSPPVHDTTTITHTVYVDSVTIDTLDVMAVDTVTLPAVHDTTVTHDTTTQYLPVEAYDKYTIWLTPIDGDNQPQIYATAVYCNDNPGYKLRLRHGLYKQYSPVILAKIVNGAYQQFSVDIAGEFECKNTPDQYQTILAPQYWDKPAIIIQQGKGVKISNLTLLGGYMMAQSFNASQVFGYRPEQWRDSINTFGRTNPNAGIAIDAISDPGDYDGVTYQMYNGLSQWYIPGMSRSGSTDVSIIGCKITRFVVGVVVTPSFQQNGELINVLNCQIGNVYAAYAWTQAQSKMNRVENLMVWSACHTVLDGVSWGKQHGDGTYAPNIDGISIAGAVHQLIQAQAYTFGITINNVYGEELLSIGSTGINPSQPTVFTNCTFDWACEPGMPSPDFWYEGKFVWFENCKFRNYNGDTTCRYILNPSHCVINGGNLGLPPYVVNDYGDTPCIQKSMLFYGKTYAHDWLSRNDYDTSYIVSQSPVRITSGYTGYFVGGNLSTLVRGDLLITQAQNVNGGIDGILAPQWNDQTPVGYVTSVSGDTVFLKRVGVSIQDNAAYPIFVTKYISNFKQ